MRNNQNTDPVIETIWKYVRGDMSTTTFERWAYSDPDLESVLGNDLYLEVIGADYTSKESVYCIRKKVSEFVRSVSNFPCKCIELCSTAVVDMGEDSEQVFRTLEEVRRRGESYWWLSVYRCRECQQWWLVAQEERYNDVFCLHRLSAETVADLLDDNHWPAIFGTYRNLLRIGLEAGKRVLFVDPLNSRSLRWTVSDLAKEKPGIGISEIAELLNLETEVATEIARRVIQEEGVSIDLDK